MLIQPANTSLCYLKRNFEKFKSIGNFIGNHLKLSGWLNF